MVKNTFAGSYEPATRHSAFGLLVWRKDADPYQIKLVRSAIRAKQAGGKSEES